jgi:Zn-dependent peptidase ImmA (M78 family)/transcriptional regulator with XRE-family HTH domain
MLPAPNRLGFRLRAFRERRALSQEALSPKLGFKDRQTLSAIETGERRLSAEELLRAAEALGVSVDELVDPFQLTGEGRFSWRQTGLSPGRLDSFEAMAGRWIAAFREIAPQVGRERPLLRQSLGLHKGSTFEEAMAAGERFAREFHLGDVPADRLPGVMEEKLHILVLMVDATPGISGAACRLPELDAVLINRKEVEGRRNFDLAHELFHLLTWETMPPEHVEEADQGAGRGKVEQLANAFAGAVLMPRYLLGGIPLYDTPETERARREYGGSDRGWSSPSAKELKARAAKMRVSGAALKWRLVALGALSRKEALAIDDKLLREGAGKLPPLYSKPFMEVLGRAIDEGRVSARRAADLAGLDLEDLADLFKTYGVPTPFEL